MRVLIPIMVGLLVVGCGKDKQTTSGQPVSQNETVIEADAESASHSLYGLEEWGKDGVKITIHYLPEDNSFNPLAIETQIGLKLRQAGITVKEKNPSSEINHELTYSNGNGFLYIIIRPVRVSDRVVAYSVIIFPRRQATYEANGKKYHRLMGPKWVYSGIAPAGKLRESINKYMDKFLIDYLRANTQGQNPSTQKTTDTDGRIFKFNDKVRFCVSASGGLRGKDIDLVISEFGEPDGSKKVKESTIFVWNRHTYINSTTGEKYGSMMIWLDKNNLEKTDGVMSAVLLPGKVKLP